MSWRRADVVATLVVAYLAAVPVAFARHTVDAFEQVKLWALLTTALALAALAPGLLDPRERPASRPSLAATVALLFVGAAALTTVFSTSRVTSLVGADESHWGLGAMAAVVALFLAGRRLARPPRGRAALLTAVLAGTAAAAAYAAGQALDRDPLSWTRLAEFEGWSRPFGTMGHPNHLGGLLAMALPLQAWVVRSALARRRLAAGVVAGIGVSLSGAVLVATLSRGAWAAAVAGLLVGLALGQPLRRRWPILLAASVLVVALGVLLVSRATGPGPLGRAVSERVLGLTTVGPRLEIWRAAGAAFRESPILGSGLDTFGLAFQRHRPPAYWTMEYDATPTRAHSDPLHAAATQGVVGLLAWCLVAAGAIGAGLRAVRRSAGLERALAAALLGGWVAFVVQVQVSFAVVATASIAAVWAAILGRSIGPAPPATAPEIGPAGRSSGIWIATGAATIAFAAGWWSDPTSTGPRFATGAVAAAAVLLAAGSQAWAAAVVLSELPDAHGARGASPPAELPTERPRKTAALLSLAWILAVLAAWALLVARPFAASVAAKGAEGAAPREAVALLTRAHRLDPLRVLYLRRLGLAMLEIDAPADAPDERAAWLERSRATLARTTRIVPVDAYGWATLALPETELAAIGRLEPAVPFQSFDEALHLDPNNVTFRVAAANTALRLRDLDRARRYAEEAAGMLPDLAPAQAQLAHVAALEGRHDEAIQKLRGALESRWYGQVEARHAAQANLVSLLIRGDLLADAERVARALVRDAPSFPPGHYQLARTLETRGAWAEAAREYEVTLQLEPTHRRAREALRRGGPAETEP